MHLTVGLTPSRGIAIPGRPMISGRTGYLSTEDDGLWKSARSRMSENSNRLLACLSFAASFLNLPLNANPDAYHRLTNAKPPS